jgi:FtsP/CotA-like multicopper oxidase with cupredoxin domain
MRFILSLAPRRLIEGSIALGVFLGASAAQGANYNLRADTGVKVLPGGVSVPIWGFADDTGAGPGSGQVSLPGPRLMVPPGDSTLTISLTNALTQEKTGLPGGVPVSLVIPGQPSSFSPVKFTDGQGRQRAQSFTKETAPGVTEVYQWNDIKPGTYLYFSGSHPAVQVPMGLYGAITKNHSASEAYPGVGFQKEALLLFSEIDPALNAAVTGGTYGTPAYPSTIAYDPHYFLINGEVFSGDPANPGALPIVSQPLTANRPTLVRFINAGLKTHVPTALGLEYSAVAEDGNKYPYDRPGNSIVLPAQKTLDAIVLPTRPGNYPIFDRSLYTFNRSVDLGGMITYLRVLEAAGEPLANNDRYGSNEDQALSVDAASGVLANDTGTAPLTAELVSTATSGTLSLQSDGSFSYSPNANFSGRDMFSYRTANALWTSAPAMVFIDVAPVNDAPIANSDAYSVAFGDSLTVAGPGVLGNDSDADGGALTAVLTAGSSRGTLALAADGSFSYTPEAGFSGVDRFSYAAFDGQAQSDAAQVEIKVEAGPGVSGNNLAPVAVNDSATTHRGRRVGIRVLSNDYDPDGTIQPGLTSIVQAPAHGRVRYIRKTGNVRYQPRALFTGWDRFSYRIKDNAGAASNIATVRVRVRRPKI